MNRNMWIVTAVVVLVVLLGGGYYFLNKNSESAKNLQEKAMMQNDQSAKQDNNANGSSGAMMKDQKPTGSDSMTKGNAVMMAKTGDYQVADNGMTLYTFDKDTKNTSNCTGQCLVAWPPYLENANKPLGMTEHLGTFTRVDGSTQYTWNGLPLYFYKGDTKVGDITGDGVGGIWHLVK